MQDRLAEPGAAHLIQQKQGFAAAQRQGTAEGGVRADGLHMGDGAGHRLAAGLFQDLKNRQGQIHLLRLFPLEKGQRQVIHRIDHRLGIRLDPLLDGEDGLEGNIQEKIISISGSVRAYIEAIINTEIARIPHGITILSLIRNGKRRYSELEDVIGKDASGVLNKELRKLVELDAVSRVVPINRNEKGRTFYEISDPLLRFYFTYIYPNPAILMSNPEVFFDSFIARSIPDFIARRFEAACREYFARLVRKGIRTDILDIGSYWYDDRERKANGEFDVALKTDSGYEVYDAKFVRKPFPEDEAEEEMRQVGRITDISVRKMGIISASGFEKASVAYVQIAADDMFGI